MERTEQSRTCTDAPQVTVVPQLRSADIPLAPLRITPRPTPPVQRLTARPLGHDLAFDGGAYDASYDRFQHHADRAFGDGTDGGAA